MEKTKMQGSLFGLLGVAKKAELKKISAATGISTDTLSYYNDHHILPTASDLGKLAGHLEMTALELKLALGYVDQTILDLISRNYSSVASAIAGRENVEERVDLSPECPLVYSSSYGKLYRGDCLTLLNAMDDASVDVVFADPPFNLKKLYPSGMDDDLKHREYIQWTQHWLSECVRVLKPNGSLFLYNLPKWNTYFSAYLNQLLTFRHWITVDIKYSLPIPGRLYPSHYSLLYYCKGDKPRIFSPDRLPMEICPHCYADLVDYGGYKDKMNPLGINLSDVWDDIPPVRHAKYKKRVGANELSIKLLDRIIEFSSAKGDVIFDPFGGSGTTYAVAELKHRKWVGVELGPCDGIIERMMNLNEEMPTLQKHRSKLNMLMDHECQMQRVRRGIWTPDTVRKREVASVELELFDER